MNKKLEESIKTDFKLALCKLGIIVSAAEDIINNKRDDCSLYEFCQKVINTAKAPEKVLKELNPMALELTELATDQIFKTGKMTEECPI